MANSQYYVFCPYYKVEKKESISCEDICRQFGSLEERNGWMKMYCASWEWEKCPYAIDLTEAYYKFERGDDKALENEKIKALEKENKSLSTHLGKAKKKIERMQKKIDELRAVNASFTAVNQETERQKKQIYTKLRDTRETLDDYEKHEAERYFKMAKLYEDRIAFLLDTYSGGRLEERTVNEWAKDKEYALTFDEKATEPVWIVKTREVDEDGEHESERISENDRAKA